jgi:hypothetical protein
LFSLIPKLYESIFLGVFIGRAVSFYGQKTTSEAAQEALPNGAIIVIFLKESRRRPACHKKNPD